MPSDKVSFDFGFFDTIFGGEVVDEWNNANYTRGALYFLRQPFNHMGIRSAFALSDKVGMTLMVTNGGVLGGTPIDGNETPTLGWQFGSATRKRTSASTSAVSTAQAATTTTRTGRTSSTGCSARAQASSRLFPTATIRCIPTAVSAWDERLRSRTATAFSSFWTRPTRSRSAFAAST